MSNRVEYKFENFMSYFGGVERVKSIIDECSCCGAKLLVSHLPDYKSLLIQENSRCLDCGKDEKRIIHVMN